MGKKAPGKGKKDIDYDKDKKTEGRPADEMIKDTAFDAEDG